MSFGKELAELVKKYNVSVYSVKDYDSDVTMVEFCHTNLDTGKLEFTTLLDDSSDEINREVKVLTHVR